MPIYTLDKKIPNQLSMLGVLGRGILGLYNRTSKTAISGMSAGSKGLNRMLRFKVIRF